MRYLGRYHFLRTRLHRTRLIGFLSVLVLVIGFAVLTTSGQQDFATQALDYVAGQQGIAIEKLQIATSTRAHLPLTKVDLAEFKVISSDGQSFGVSFNVATQQVVDPLIAAEKERQARVATFGIVEPVFFNRLQLSAAERIPVAVWVAMEDPGTLGRGPNADFNALEARVRAAQTPAADAARGLGAAIELSDLVPVFVAELNAGQINALAKRPSVVAIEAVPQNLVRHNDDSATSDRYPFIWSKATGYGAKVAVHEDDGLDDVSPFLIDPAYWCPGVATGPGGAGCTTGKNIQSHATNVAGVILSTHPWRRGGAWGIAAGSLLSANFQSFGSATNIVNSASWALANGADTINMSWGTLCSDGKPNFYSRWVDYLVKTFGRSIVVSAGNSTCPSGPQYVSAPSLGWNTISVGSYFDNDTGLRSDDVLSSFSSFSNPTDPNSGRTYEKPDVTGMGGQVDATGCHGVDTTSVGGGVNDHTCGTSFAAPDVSALTALVVGKNPTGLRNAAEAVKAIIMAGATHNIIDGVNYTDCSSSPVPGDCRDGAGAIDASQTIDNIVVPGNWRYPGLITPASFDASGNIDYPVSIGSGKNIRVALAWDSTATCSNLGTTSQACTNDVLNADLDLHLIDPFGALVALSASFQNSAEVIDYKTTASGTFTIRVHNFRFDAGTNTHLGVAWNLNTEDSLNPLTGATIFTLNTTKTNQTTDKGYSFWDTYSGPASGCASFLNSETGLEKVYQVTTSSTGQITATLSNITGFTGANNDLDVIILKQGGSANNQNSQVIACGESTAVASGQPAGTYFVVVDGSNGSVAKFDLTINFLAGALVWTDQDIGAVGVAGSASSAGGAFTVSGSGADIWNTADAFHYVFQPLNGDGQILARVASLQNTDPWAKAGVMIRETLTANSRHGMMALTSANGLAFMRRIITAGTTTRSGLTAGAAPYWVKLVRTGNTFSGYQSSNGVNWVLAGTDTITMAQNAYVGLAVTSHNNSVLNTSTFDNVNVTLGTANNPPTVSITSPSNGAAFTAPANITITANASDSDGSISQVDFYQGTTRLGTDTSSPYSFTWNNVAAGSYTLSAKATDDQGAVSTSSAVNITVNSSSASLPPPWADQDIGAVGVAGSASFAGDTFTVSGSGADIWNTADAFHYVFQPLNGDGQILARVASLQNTDPWAKVGVMIRETLTANSRHAMMALTSGNGLAFMRRIITAGSTTRSALTAGAAPYWVKLVRTGNAFSGYQSSNGVNWVLVGTDTIPMTTTVYMGLAVSAHNNTVLNTSTFDNLNVALGTANNPLVVGIASPNNGATFQRQLSTGDLTWHTSGDSSQLPTSSELLPQR